MRLSQVDYSPLEALLCDGTPNCISVRTISEQQPSVGRREQLSTRFHAAGVYVKASSSSPFSRELLTAQECDAIAVFSSGHFAKSFSQNVSRPRVYNVHPRRDYGAFARARDNEIESRKKQR